MQEESSVTFLEMLISAVQSQDVEQVKHLLESGKVCLDDQNSSLCRACKQNSLEIVKLLIKHGADVNGGEGLATWDCFFPPGDSKKAIHYACNGEGDRRELIKCLINAGCDINAQDVNLATAFTYATFRKNTSVVNLLIESGADVNIVDMTGETPLKIASNQTNVELIKILLKPGSDPTVSSMASIHSCLQLDCPEGVKQLYQASRALVRDDGYYSQQRKLELFNGRFRHLLDIVDRSYGSEPWLPALLIACSSPFFDPWKVLQTLLDLGADVNDKDPSGFNCLQHACSRVNVKCVMTLLDYGVNPTDHSWERLWKVFPPLGKPSLRLKRKTFPFHRQRIPTFQDYLGILKLLVSAGFGIDEESARVFTKAVKLPSASAWSGKEKTRFKKFLKNYRTVPMSLSDCCRIKVRQCLKINIKHSIEKLKLDNILPVELTDYLRFEDIIEALI